jgi:transcriptional regulator
MYTSQYFREARPQVIRSLIDSYPFATLIGYSTTGLMATHLPLLFEADHAPLGKLVGHMARGNAQWRDTAEGSEVLAVLQGPHSYVSPRWYTAEPDVPTWNYQAAHVRGTWRIERDPARVMAQLEAMIAKLEADSARAAVGPAAASPAPQADSFRPWRLDTLDDALVAGLHRAIVAFEIQITRIDCAFKLSQDKTVEDRMAVIAGLERTVEGAARDTAIAMRRYYEDQLTVRGT